jgi:hypothetical protein
MWRHFDIRRIPDLCQPLLNPTWCHWATPANEKVICLFILWPDL